MNKGTVDFHCIFEHRLVSVGFVLAFILAGTSEAMKMARGEFDPAGGAMILFELILATVILVSLAASARCWSQRLVGVLLLAVVLVKLVSLTLAPVPAVFKLHLLLATCVYFACAVIVAVSFVRGLQKSAD